MIVLFFTRELYASWYFEKLSWFVFALLAEEKRIVRPSLPMRPVRSLSERGRRFRTLCFSIIVIFATQLPVRVPHASIGVDRGIRYSERARWHGI